MADDAATSSEETQITFNVKSANDAKYVITILSSSTVADLKAKLATSEFADIPPERQRLIYSGRVLKDPDTLASAKIKDGNTVHLVKSAASNAQQNPASQGTSTGSGAPNPTPQVPSMAAGTGNNPLAGLTGARYAGFHGLPGADMFGPDGGMGPPPDSSQLLELMDNPMFLSQMNEAMNNPAVIDMMTQSPMIRNNPMLADMIRNPEMRRMLFNPEMMRMQLQMQRSMGGGGGQRMAAPGATDNTPETGAAATGEGANVTTNQPNTNTAADPTANLFGGAGGSAGGQGNPFAGLFGAQPGGFGQPQQQNQNQGSNPESNNPGAAPPAANPFGNLFGGAGGDGQANPIADMTRRMMQDPQAMQAAMNMFSNMQAGGGAAGAGASPFGAAPQNPSGAGSPPPANPFAALFGPGGGLGGAGGFGTPPPQDNRPPEEVYEAQLRQLNEMGFYDFNRNVSALRRSGGNVQGAIEYLFSETS